MQEETRRLGAWVRMAVLLLALVNQALVLGGKSVLPFTSAELEAVLSTLFTAAAALAAWWKNNSVTQKAQAADSVLAALKSGRISAETLRETLAAREEKDDV